ncbi:MAG: tetratricopeptide repeat-containing protein [Saprospiraceae bacterium]|nr:tetratricopeptide repeat-containing protein [Saprospiraceae bacterium]MBP7699642.1 tetratricopeptide repeat-containing protein [Saprospiraceae bacterium]
MQTEDFILLLKEPRCLENVRFADLQAMVSAFPYCQNLRVLLLQKSAIEQMHEYEELLHDAAAFSMDRNFLFQNTIKFRYIKEEKSDDEVGEQEHKTAPEPLHVTDEATAFSATALSYPDDEKAIIAPAEKIITETSIHSLSEISIDEDEIQLQASSLLERLITDEQEPIAATNIQPTPKAEQQVIETEIIEKGEIVSTQKETIIQTNTAPKSAFSSWLRQLKPVAKKTSTQPESDTIKNTKNQNTEKPVEKSDSPSIAKQLAKQSLQEDGDIATETLAQLLEKQGRWDKAIRMYEKLLLLFPEKSSFFATKIEVLSKKLNKD